jgi:NAD(P)H dehydrogenase (quinone)
MSRPKIAVIFYSTYGTNHAIAEAAAKAAEAAGAEVRLLRVAETAPEAAVNGQPAWKAQAEKMASIPVATPDDMAWADGYFISCPTRYGVSASQLRAFIDTLGPVWQKGGLSNKPITATTSAGNPHGGQEATILSLYTTAMHWGAIIVAPGYTDDAIAAAGGNPYGYSAKAGEFDDKGRAAVAHQARRLVEMTKKLMA